MCRSRCSLYPLGPIDPAMIWLFERVHETLSVETEYDSVSGEYLVTRRRPDGDSIVEAQPHGELVDGVPKAWKA